METAYGARILWKLYFAPDAELTTEQILNQVDDEDDEERYYLHPDSRAILDGLPSIDVFALKQLDLWPQEATDGA